MIERRASSTGATAAIVALLAVVNVMSNRVLPAAAYVPWNLSAAVVITIIARHSVADADLGLGSWLRGLRFGMVLFVVTAGVLSMGLAMPAVNKLFEDRRVDGGVITLLYQAVIRIPLGTVILEEMAFRSVLPAMFALRSGVLRGSIYASALFGLWHVLPALNINTVNPVARNVFGSGAGGKAVAVLFAVAGTMLAGLWFCLLRYRSRSILTSMLGHMATNSVGFTMAWIVAR